MQLEFTCVILTPNKSQLVYSKLSSKISQIYMDLIKPRAAD